MWTSPRGPKLDAAAYVGISMMMIQDHRPPHDNDSVDPDELMIVADLAVAHAPIERIGGVDLSPWTQALDAAAASEACWDEDVALPVGGVVVVVMIVMMMVVLVMMMMMTTSGVAVGVPSRAADPARGPAAPRPPRRHQLPTTGLAV
jgi:hypothetical protein